MVQVKLANNEEQKLDIFLLPHILSFDLISYLKGIKNMLRKAYESIKEIQAKLEALLRQGRTF